MRRLARPIVQHRLASRILALLILSFMCGYALIHAISVVRAYEWPDFQVDMFRDIAIAQTYLHGEYPRDYVLAGANNWYNPLTGMVVALGSRLGGVPPQTADTRLGPYLNLLAPISLFVLVASMFDIWTALAACAFFLFSIRGDVPSYIYGTYSPWLRAGNMSQCLFFGSLWLMWLGHRDRKTRFYVAAGVLHGLTFMGHTAPAVLLGVIATMLAGLRAWNARNQREPLWRSMGDFALELGTAFVTSLPYTLPLIVRYQFHVKHISPFLYVDPSVLLSNWPAFARSFVAWTTLPTIMAIIVLSANRRHRPQAVILFTWLLLALGFLANGFAQQHWPAFGRYSLRIVPVHHFLQYLRTLQAILEGAGLMWCVRWIGRVSVGERRSRSSFAYAAVVMILLAILLPGYAQWKEMQIAAHTSLDDVKGTEAAQRWIAGNCAPSDVFLAPRFLSLLAVSTAGCKAVATNHMFMNPYEDYERRNTDSDSMFAALAQGDNASFVVLAAQYRVTYVMTVHEPISPLAAPWLIRVHAAEDVAIYRLVAPESRLPQPIVPEAIDPTGDGRPFLSGFGPAPIPEIMDGSRYVWPIAPEVSVQLYVQANTPVRLEWETFLPKTCKSRALRCSVNDGPPAPCNISEGRNSFQADIPSSALEPGLNRIRFTWEQGNDALPDGIILRGGAKTPFVTGGIVFPDGTSCQGKRGYGIATLRPDGKGVALFKEWDPYTDQNAWPSFIRYITSLPASTPVAFFTSNESTSNMSAEAVDALGTLGSAVDVRGKPYCTHAGFGVKGMKPGEAMENTNPDCSVTIVTGRCAFSAFRFSRLENAP